MEPPVFIDSNTADNAFIPVPFLDFLHLAIVLLIKVKMLVEEF